MFRERLFRSLIFQVGGPLQFLLIRSHSEINIVLVFIFITSVDWREVVSSATSNALPPCSNLSQAVDVRSASSLQITGPTLCPCPLKRIIEHSVALHLLFELIADLKAILGNFLVFLQHSSKLLLLALLVLRILVLFASLDFFHLIFILILVVHLFGQAFLITLKRIFFPLEFLHKHVTKLLFTKLSIGHLLVEDDLPFLHEATLFLDFDIGVDVRRGVLRFPACCQNSQGLSWTGQAVSTIAIWLHHWGLPTSEYSTTLPDHTNAFTITVDAAHLAFLGRQWHIST